MGQNYNLNWPYPTFLALIGALVQSFLLSKLVDIVKDVLGLGAQLAASKKNTLVTFGIVSYYRIELELRPESYLNTYGFMGFVNQVSLTF